MYYRVAIQVASSSPTWQWKSTTLSSLNALFQFLRRYRNLPQDHLRVFSSSCEDMDEQLVRENNGLGSQSVTAAQFMQARMIGSQQGQSFTGDTSPSSNESSGGTGAKDVKKLSSPGRRQVGRGDFWNLMALAEA